LALKPLMIHKIYVFDIGCGTSHIGLWGSVVLLIKSSDLENFMFLTLLESKKIYLIISYV
jgi:hypothetical protein